MYPHWLQPPLKTSHLQLTLGGKPRSNGFFVWIEVIGGPLIISASVSVNRKIIECTVKNIGVLEVFFEKNTVGIGNFLKSANKTQYQKNQNKNNSLIEVGKKIMYNLKNEIKWVNFWSTFIL